MTAPISSVLPHNLLESVHVLCVDDSPEALALLTRVFEHYGAQVTACPSAELALGFILVAKFDVIVSDLDMPGMDGYDLAHALRNIERGRPGDTPTVMVSSKANVPSVKRLYADFQVYMSKPIDHLKLVKVIDRLVEADGGAVRAGSLDTWERENGKQVNSSLHQR